MSAIGSQFRGLLPVVLGLLCAPNVGARPIAEKVPFLDKSVTAFDVAGQDVKVTVRIPLGYKLNQDAPNWGALFAEGGIESEKEWKVADLISGEIRTGRLVEGRTYRMQLVISTCKAGRTPSSCRMQGYDFTLRPGAGTHDAVVLELR